MVIFGAAMSSCSRAGFSCCGVACSWLGGSCCFSPCPGFLLFCAWLFALGSWFGFSLFVLFFSSFWFSWLALGDSPFMATYRGFQSPVACCVGSLGVSFFCVFLCCLSCWRDFLPTSFCCSIFCSFGCAVCCSRYLGFILIIGCSC